MLETNHNRNEKQQRDLQRLKTLRPIDDDFMRCIFKENISLVEHILRIFTQKPDLTITSFTTQADMKRLVGARSICLDAYGSDTLGQKYDIEVQRADKGAGAHRARYHASAVNIENLDAGQNFDDLPNVYIIFITENDVFGEGKSIYSVERANLSTGKL